MRAPGPPLVVAYSERLGAVTEAERRLERELGAEIRHVPLWSVADVRSNARDADAVLVGAVEPMDAASLHELKRCRVLVRRGVGLDNIDLAAATRMGLPVAFVPDASVEDVSDHALALLLTLERNINGLDRAVREGLWLRDANTLAGIRGRLRRFKTLTLGIVGFGRIGQRLARKSQVLFADILVYDPFTEDEASGLYGTESVGFGELLARSDFISIHAPLTPETRHLFDAKAFSQMQAGSYIVNTARGGLIDEEALVEALEHGRIAGAGLDVTEQEPLPASSPLLEAENVLLTAHSAAMSRTGAEELRQSAVEATLLALQGRRPPALANAEVLARPDCRLRLRDNAGGR